MGPLNCNNDGWHIGLANVAAFLSQAMTTAILDDTCDEINWEMVVEPGEEDGGVYPLSNACGQRGWSYSASSFYVCNDAEEERFQCDVDLSMEVTAVTKSTLELSPPPLKCFPRSENQPYTGYFDPIQAIVRVDKVVASVSGRTDVEGCVCAGGFLPLLFHTSVTFFHL